MEKKSVVRSAIYQKAFNGKNGEAHIFEIIFDNGDKGQFFSSTKDQSTFKEGTETEYTYEQKINGQYTNYYVKPVRQGGFVPGKGNPAYEHKRVALKCAVDLCVSNKILLGEIKAYCESFMKFLNE